MPDRHLIVFAKAPRPGCVKSRLARALGEEAAAEAYAAMLRDTLNSTRAAAQLAATPPQTCRVTLAHEPADAMRAGPYSLAAFWNGEARPQGEGDLGARMRRCLNAALPQSPQSPQGATQAVLIGSDSPDLPAEHIAATFEFLSSTTPLALGPAQDGGFYLIGASTKLPPAIFDNVTWSAPATLQQVTANAARLQLDVALLAKWRDVDDIDDLRALAARLQRPQSEYSGRAPAMRAWLAAQDWIQSEPADGG